jgi:hypothetical protein
MQFGVPEANEGRKAFGCRFWLDRTRDSCGLNAKVDEHFRCTLGEYLGQSFFVGFARQ